VNGLLSPDAAAPVVAAAPDAQVAEAAPEAVRKAVTFGRPPHPVPS